MDGEQIVDIEPVICYLHRAIEKMCENRTYYQIVPLTDRFEYVTSMACNHVYALAVEKLLELEVPERAEYLRVIMVELNRIASHLLFYGVTAMDIGAYTPFLYGLREREKIVDLFEMTCGQRLTYNYIRIGGVRSDIPPEFESTCREAMDHIEEKLEDYEGLLNENPIWLIRTKNIGVLPPDTAIAYGCSGPVLRASGVNYDVRRNDPYSVYDKFDFNIPTQQNGDTFDRYIQRLDEIRESIKIVRQALDGLPEGDHIAKMKPRLKVPEGQVFNRLESARGEMGCHIVADGSNKPLRVKFRGSSFNHIAVLPEIVKGVLIADLVAIFATMDVIMPEVDR
jgi:NADH-quinone oxidoreductase subunit D